MSAEKELVNFWLNKRGFYTINDIKASNRDLGIIALKFEKDKVKELNHFEIFCSITSSLRGLKDSVDKVVNEKFSSKSIQKTIKKYLDQFNIKESSRFLIISNIVNKKQTTKRFKDKNIEVIYFGDVLADIIKDLDTQYYKKDIIRSLQLVKYLFLSNPKNMAQILVDNVLSTNQRHEFMKELLDKEDIVKEFRKTNEERLAEILKYSSLKDPNKLALLIENNVLNRKTRKKFLSSLLEQKKMKKLYKEEFTPKKKETPLNKFF